MFGRVPKFWSPGVDHEFVGLPPVARAQAAVARLAHQALHAMLGRELLPAEGRLRVDAQVALRDVCAACDPAEQYSVSSQLVFNSYSISTLLWLRWYY